MGLMQDHVKWHFLKIWVQYINEFRELYILKNYIQKEKLYPIYQTL